jgi:hypothetical protein
VFFDSFLLVLLAFSDTVVLLFAGHCFAFFVVPFPFIEDFGEADLHLTGEAPFLCCLFLLGSPITIGLCREMD